MLDAEVITLTLACSASALIKALEPLPLPSRMVRPPFSASPLAPVKLLPSDSPILPLLNTAFQSIPSWSCLRFSTL
ncbi:hypothetical protein D3C81_1905090 [compost metagenome]